MRIFITFLFLMTGLVAGAQHDPLVSQYLLNGLVINPAYTGSREVFTVNGLYRNQWVGIDGAPVTQVISAHTPLKNKSLALGMLFSNEKIGVSNSTSINANVAYRIAMNKATLSFGVSVGMNLLSSNFTELATTEGNDLAFAGDLRSNIQPDFGAGIYYQSKKYFVGLSIPRFISRQYHYTDGQLDIQSKAGVHNLILNGGMLVKLSSQFKLKPSTLLRYAQSGDYQIDLNANLIYNDFLWLGISYRHAESVVALLEVQINQQFRVAYAYDYSLSIFRKYTSGSHEIGLQYEFGYRVKSMDPRFF